MAGGRGGAWIPSADADAPSRGFNPPQTRRLWRDRLLPWLVVPLFWAYWIALLPSRLGARSPRDVRLGIESGKIGWTHVFFEELRDSALEYLGPGAVEQIVIDRELPYRPQAKAWIGGLDLSHAVIDVRTGSQRWPAVLRDLFTVTWLLNRRGVIPIVILADAGLRRHRLQAAVLTAYSGIVVTFMDKSIVRQAFPHPRIAGPVPIPLSVARLRSLEAIRAASSGPVSIRFIGRMYEPRRQFLEAVCSELAGRGIAVEVLSDKYSTSNDDYWRVLATSDIILTTTMQGMPRADLDWIWVQQLVFRFTEALAAGAALVSPTPPGADRSFAPGIDFATFTSVDEAVLQILELVDDPALRCRIADQGHRTVADLIEKHAFWVDIDQRLTRPMRSV